MAEFTWQAPDLRNREDLPHLGGTLLRIQKWHAREGDRAETNQPLVTLETQDGDISLTIDAPVTGTIKSLLLTTGQTVQAGDILAIFEVEQ